MMAYTNQKITNVLIENSALNYLSAIGNRIVLKNEQRVSIQRLLVDRDVIGVILSEPHSLVAHRAQAQCIMVRCTYVHGTFATVI